jgi:thermosome
VEVAKTQDEECGDGTTTAVVLTGEFLKRAEDMLEQNIHPTIICDGYRLAAIKSQEILDNMADSIDINDKDILLKIATTAMYSKAARVSKERLAQIAVDAVTSIADEIDGKYSVDLDNVQIVRKQGKSLEDTQLIEGVILDKERAYMGMPGEVWIAKIALVNSALEVKKTEVDANIHITIPNQMEAFLAEEERVLKEMVQKLKNTGTNVLFCEKGIDDLAQHFLAREGIYAVSNIKDADMKKLSKACGASIIMRLEDLTDSDLGAAQLVGERRIGDDNMTFVTGCENAKAVSVLVRGGTEHVIEEAERSLDDALNVVAAAIEDGKIVAGGGALAAEVALRLREYASTVGGREQMAVEAYANAMEIVPRTLAENAGLDSMDILIDLRKAHASGDKRAGINIETEEIVDMEKFNIIEPLRIGKQAINSATDAAVMILRIDDVIAAKHAGGRGSGIGPDDE